MNSPTVAVCGSLNVDSIWLLAKMPKYHEKIRALAHGKICGGSATHTALAIASTGVDVSLIGEIQSAEDAKKFNDELSGQGIGMKGVEVGRTFRSGQSVVLLCDSDKRIITAPSSPMEPPIPTAAQLEVAEQSTWIHLAATEDKWSTAIVRHALKAGAELSIEMKGNSFPHLIKHATVAFMNSEEFKRLYNISVNQATALAFWPKIGPMCSLVVTNSGGPVHVFSPRRNGDRLHYTVEVPKLESKITNRNGAGDTFNGGFISSFIQNKDINLAIIDGQSHAAKKLTSEVFPAQPS